MTCAICQEKCTKKSHTLDCGHKFHAGCVISWFRTGETTCPICRDGGAQMQTTFKYLQRLSDMPSCPVFIKDAIKDYNKMQGEIKKLYDLKTNCESNSGKKKINNLIKRQNKLLKTAKKTLCKSQIFIVPIKKIIF